MTSIDKQALLQTFIHALEGKRDVMLRATKAAHEAATHEEANAEHKYDTRGLEASYLAGAQSKRMAEIEHSIRLFQRLALKDFGPDDPIALSAVIELDTDDGTLWYFLAPGGGGTDVSFEGRQFSALTLKSPLGRQLLGAQQGDVIELTIQRKDLEYEIMSVR